MRAISTGRTRRLATTDQQRAGQFGRSLWTLLTLVAVLGAWILGVSGCERPEKPLRVGTNVWPGYEPMYMARSLGYYGNQQIQLVDLPSTSEVVRAYHDGLIDVAAVTSDEALSATQGQTNQRIVLVCDFSKGADVLLAKPGIASLQDLKGRRVGVETTVLGAYMLGRALERAGLSVSDVQVVPTPLLEHEAAYKSGTVDAVVTFEPHRSRLLAAGAHTLFDSSEIPGEIVDVLLTRRDLSPSQNRAVATLVSGWFRSLAYLQKNPSDAAARMAQREAVTPQEFLASLQGLELPDRAANLRLLEGPSGTLNDTLGRLSAVMVRQNMASQQITPPVLDASFVKMAEP